MSVLLTSSDMFLQLTAQFLYVWVVYEMHGCVTGSLFFSFVLLLVVPEREITAVWSNCRKLLIHYKSKH